MVWQRIRKRNLAFLPRQGRLQPSENWGGQILAHSNHIYRGMRLELKLPNASITASLSMSFFRSRSVARIIRFDIHKSPIVVLSLVLMRFMAEKALSVVAVDTGRTHTRQIKRYNAGNNALWSVRYITVHSSWVVFRFLNLLSLLAMTKNRVASSRRSSKSPLKSSRSN